MKQTGRSKLIAIIHVGKKELGLDDDTYRDMLQHVTGKRSAKDLNISELNKVIRELEQKGFKHESKRSFGTKPDVASQKEPLMGKIEALLADQQLHWNYAKAIAKQMFNKEALEFCTKKELYRIVAALEYKKKRTQDGARRSTRQTP